MKKTTNELFQAEAYVSPEMTSTEMALQSFLATSNVDAGPEDWTAGNINWF